MERTRKRYPLIITAGAIIMLAGITALILDADHTVTTMIMSTGTVMVVIGIIAGMRSEAQVRPDERVRKISARSLSWSWLATFLTMGVIAWLDLLGLVALTVQQTLAIVYAAMLISALGSRAYLARRGDVL